MKTTIHCPNCAKTVSLMAFFKALTPFSFVCPQCRCRIRVHLRGLKAVALLAAAALIWAFPAMVYVSREYGLTAALLLVGTLLPAWVALDLVLGIWVFTKGRFTADPAAKK